MPAPRAHYLATRVAVRLDRIFLEHYHLRASGDRRDSGCQLRRGAREARLNCVNSPPQLQQVSAGPVPEISAIAGRDLDQR